MAMSAAPGRLFLWGRAVLWTVLFWLTVFYSTGAALTFTLALWLLASLSIYPLTVKDLRSALCHGAGWLFVLPYAVGLISYKIWIRERADARDRARQREANRGR